MSVEITSSSFDELEYVMSVRTENHINPVEALKEVAEIIKKQNPDHPMFQAKKYEFISLPRKYGWRAEVRDFVTSPEFQRDIIYIAIFQLDHEVTVWKNAEETAGSKVKDYPHKGTRKWVTKYVVYRKDTKEELGQYDTKAEAVSFAKTYTANNNCETYVRIEKRLADNSHLVADIQPVKRKKRISETHYYNYYIYFGKASGQ